MFYYYYNEALTDTTKDTEIASTVTRARLTGDPLFLPSSGGPGNLNVFIKLSTDYLVDYHYVWSQKETRFVRFNLRGKYHVAPKYAGTLVASVPDRLHVEKHLKQPMVFVSPLIASEWVRRNSDGIPPLYAGKTFTLADPKNYVHPNNLIINISELTFSYDHTEEYLFTPSQDGIILTVMDRYCESTYPPALFGYDGKYLFCESESSALKVLRDILAYRLP